MTVDELKKRLSLPVIGAPMFLASGVDLVVAGVPFSWVFLG